MIEYQKKLSNMKELKKIATDLETNYFNSRKKKYALFRLYAQDLEIM